MKRAYFQSIENLSCGEVLPLNDVLKQLAFNEQGLIPVVTQEAESKEVLMLAWMDRQAPEATLMTRRMTYWSRSRNELWVKGESSGNVQILETVRFDCDGDAVLCSVTQAGAACHTQREHCFLS